jgi:hypothetical protein
MIKSTFVLTFSWTVLNGTDSAIAGPAVIEQVSEVVNALLSPSLEATR